MPATVNAVENRLAGAPEVLVSDLWKQHSRSRARCAGRTDDAGADARRRTISGYRAGAGSDGPGNSFVYIPSLKAVVTGDVVFDHVYFGVTRDKAREDWSKTIDQIIAAARHHCAGPEGPGRRATCASIQFMKKYMADWDANFAASKNAAEMKAKVLAQYPGLGMEFTLNDRVATYFPAPKP